MARSTYYYHVKRQDKADKYAETKAKITEIYHSNKGRYGYRRITMELRSNGDKINHKTVQRLMKQLGLVCMVRIKKYKSYKGEVGKIAPNLLARDFSASTPNEKWLTDVTEFSLFGQKLYLSPILDLYNGEIISYTICGSPSFSSVMTMLDNAVERLPKQHSLMLHSDQGWQYQMKPFQRKLAENCITQSMSRKGNCLDNSVMENFFGTLKSELLYLQKFDNMEHFIDELHDYIFYYNHHRIKLKLNGMSPVAFRTHSTLTA